LFPNPERFLFRRGSIKADAEIGLKGDTMSAFKVVRNAVGTVGLLFAGYVFVMSVKDSWRYLKMSRM
jgi:hypothetical protein